MESTSSLKDILINRQEELKHHICLESKIDIHNLEKIAGVDLAYWIQNDKEYACCCIVVIDYTKENHLIIEKKYCIGEITVPYIPGCLAFREYDLVEKAVGELVSDVDLFIFDGNGYLHPRHMGLATYAGIMLGKPSIGVAKSFYKFVEFDYSKLVDEEFAYKDIVIDDEIYGRVLRTHKGVKPIFLSIGNMITIDEATEIIKNLISEESRIPIPTRYADIMTHEIRKSARLCVKG